MNGPWALAQGDGWVGKEAYLETGRCTLELVEQRIRNGISTDTLCTQRLWEFGSQNLELKHCHLPGLRHTK